jgi:hypothetical protein
MSNHPLYKAKLRGSKVLRLSLLVAVAALTATLAGCGTTPEPTEPPPTQTPWIIVVTATPGPGEAAVVQPSQTPWIIIATPTTAVQPQAMATPKASPAATTGTTQPTATATRKPPAPTVTPKAAELKYPPPALLDPPNDQPVSWKSTVTLRWSSAGQLAKDEYYHLHLERRPQTEGDSWYGDYVYTKDTKYLAEGAFLAPFHPPAEQGKGVVYWWVRVVRKTGEDQSGKPIGVDVGETSEERTLILDPKPAGE